MFLSTLYCEKEGNNDHFRVDEYEMDDKDVENLKNPFLPHHTLPHRSDATSHSSASQHASMSLGGAASLSAPPDIYTNSSTQKTKFTNQ